MTRTVAGGAKIKLQQCMAGVIEVGSMVTDGCKVGGRCVETICETGRRRVRRRQANSAAGQDGERTSRHQYQGFQGPETVFDRQPTEDFTLRRESPGVGSLPPVGVHRNHLGY